LAGAKLVLKPRSFEIEIESDHALAKGGQESRRVSQKQRSANTAFVGIEGYGLHGSSCQAESASLAKATSKILRLTPAMML